MWHQGFRSGSRIRGGPDAHGPAPARPASRREPPSSRPPGADPGVRRFPPNPTFDPDPDAVPAPPFGARRRRGYDQSSFSCCRDAGRKICPRLWATLTPTMPAHVMNRPPAPALTAPIADSGIAAIMVKPAKP